MHPSGGCPRSRAASSEADAGGDCAAGEHGPGARHPLTSTPADKPPKSDVLDAELLAELHPQDGARGSSQHPLLATEPNIAILKFLSKTFAVYSSENDGLIDGDASVDDSSFMEDPDSADLAAGFRVLGLHTARIALANAAHLDTREPANIDVAQELCYFLSLAPECYRQFRLFACVTRPAHFRIDVTSGHVPSDATHCVTDSSDSLPAVAAAMRQYADVERLAFHMIRRTCMWCATSLEQCL